MPLLLSTTATLNVAYDLWCAIGQAPSLDPARQAPFLAQKLEAAFDAARNDWWALGHQLGQEPSAVFAHTPACASNASDFGLMLAWSKIADDLACGPEKVLMVCDDPWLFRHLSLRQGVSALTKPPSLLWPTLRLRARGLLARLSASCRFAGSSLRLRHMSQPESKAPSLLVYGHPRSAADGDDAYFGNLLKVISGLVRILHIDASVERASALGKKGRAFSLHGYGSWIFALTLWRARWRAKREEKYIWLLRRAEELEGSTAQAAAILWQLHCQDRWLRKARPRLVCWPWENHSWERALVRSCRRMGIATIGYQHATVGWREWNYSPKSNPDGISSLPDKIFCVGNHDMARLIAYGCDPNRISVAGALRYGDPLTTTYDSKAPIFVALPFDFDICAEMIAALRPLAEKGMQFLVKDHPMSPFAFKESANLRRIDQPLGAQKSVAGVLYCITTVGLEALLAGLPTLRFLPASKVAVDSAPEGVTVPAASASDLELALTHIGVTPAPARFDVFASPNIDLWKSAFEGGAC